MNSSKNKHKQTNEDIVKLDHRSHILKLPETYIGSIEQNTEDKWHFSDEENKIVKKSITIIPGEYKIFDEIIVNAYDQHIRTLAIDSEHKVKNIRIDINKETGEIMVKNDER